MLSFTKLNLELTLSQGAAMEKEGKLTAFRRMEDAYLRLFAHTEECEYFTRFTEPELPAMYSHNCVVFRENVDEPDLHNQIKILFEDAQICDANHLYIVLGPNQNFTMNAWEADVFDVSSELYMTMALDAYQPAPSNPACQVFQATTASLRQDAAWCDIVAGLMEGFKHLDYTFAYQRAFRKQSVLKQYPSVLSQYVAYVNDIPVGKCEVQRYNDILSPDSFLVVPDFQRKGIGTAILNRIFEDGKTAGCREAFLVANTEETAKEMYMKIGFQTIGTEHSLLWLKRK